MFMFILQPHLLYYLYSNCLVEMDDERESVMMSAEEQKENDLQVGTTHILHTQCTHVDYLIICRFQACYCCNLLVIYTTLLFSRCFGPT